MKEKKNEGITLIALVITIIVLLILAGVTLSTLFGNNGILTESQLAVEANKEANAKEQVQLAWTACETEYQAAWTKDSSVEKSGYFQKENLNRNLGTGTVKSVGYVENGKSTVTYTLDGTEYEFEIANGQVYKIGQAPDVTNPTPQEPELTSGKLTDIIKANNYGDTINYSANGVTDWKIFYKDEENVFIIASECLPGNKIPSISTMRKSGNNVYWDYDTTFQNEGARKIDSTTARKFELNWLFVGEHGSSQNFNMKCVQDLMDTSKWSAFATGVSGAKAIGSPTLEMWINSWNAKYPDEPLIFNKGESTNSDGSVYEYDDEFVWDSRDRDYGYVVGGKVKDNQNIAHSTYLTSALGFLNGSYEKYLEYLSGSEWLISLDYKNGISDSLYSGVYWLSSPGHSPNTIDDLNEDEYTGTYPGPTYETNWDEWGAVSLFSFYSDARLHNQGQAGLFDNPAFWSGSESCGLRPVVCLPTDTSAQWKDNTWEIINN